ncbi:MAG TPA: ethanolamine ammonia-lyase subunit EutC [Candidatus Acidoferrum sp.]|nr:ethanolamine ammonia-lyase subunit EutC [Candidatus Acidoferrum sp.]
MHDRSEKIVPNVDSAEIVRRIKMHTPARLLVGRAGAAYRTETQLQLREDHAKARDAVRSDLDLKKAFAAEFIEKWNLFEVSTKASTKVEYLARPALGREFTDASRAEILKKCLPNKSIQVVIGDGLSALAIQTQIPQLLPLLFDGASKFGWSVGQAFVVRHCRVGILNEIGELLKPQVAILLIGERPGLATAESMSAYMAFQASRSHSDANRNLISNIHDRGLSTATAAARILNLCAHMMRLRISGCTLKEQEATLLSGPNR